MGQVKLRVKQGEDGQWYPSVRSPNGQVILVGEGYKRKGGAIRGLVNAVIKIRDAVQLIPDKAIADALIDVVGADGRTIA